MSPEIITDEMILSYESVPPDIAAKYLGKSKDFIYGGMQKGALPFGVAVKLGTWQYDIRPEALVDYKHNGRKDAIDGLLDYMAEAMVYAFEAKMRGTTIHIGA